VCYHAKILELMLARRIVSWKAWKIQAIAALGEGKAERSAMTHR
jgi:hypothetical protein